MNKMILVWQEFLQKGQNGKENLYIDQHRYVTCRLYRTLSQKKNVFFSFGIKFDQNCFLTLKIYNNIIKKMAK